MRVRVLHVPTLAATVASVEGQAPCNNYVNANARSLQHTNALRRGFSKGGVVPTSGKIGIARLTSPRSTLIGTRCARARRLSRQDPPASAGRSRSGAIPARPYVREPRQRNLAPAAAAGAFRRPSTEIIQRGQCHVTLIFCGHPLQMTLSGNFLRVALTSLENFRNLVALVGHVLDPDAGLLSERLADQMTRAADAG